MVEQHKSSNNEDQREHVNANFNQNKMHIQDILVEQKEDILPRP